LGGRSIRVRAPAKLNLSLRVVGRRPDGYHLLDSLVVPINVFDVLEVRAVEAKRSRVKISPRSPDVRPGLNLAVRAARLFLDQTRQPAEVDIRISKNIPVGAGLGGGSSDAAAVLLALNRIFARRIPRPRLALWGLALGADVPFFVHGHPARVTGIGERVAGVPVRFPWCVVVAFAGAPLSTAEVYRTHSLTPASSLTTTRGNSSIPLSISERTLPGDLLVNDLETAAMAIDPGVRTLKQRLRQLGAVWALMTGSGSAVFGIWSRQEEARSAVRRLEEEGIWARMVEILGRSPNMTPAGGR
jgi:4-diphosphocytidyl-2-C-methyl-D-erythritol kinase